MSIEDLKNRATIIREETRPLANTAEKVGSVMYETLEAIEDLTTSTSDLAIQEVSIQPVYKDGIIELRCTPDFTSTSKGIFQGKLNQLTVESTLTTPYLDAFCIIKITGVSKNLSGLTIKKRICQYRDIVDKRIMFELNVPNLLSPFTANNSPIMLINGVKEPIVTIAKTNDQEVGLANEGNYDQNYTASQLSGKSVLITALTEGCSIILPLPYNLPVGEYNGQSINFQISETSEPLTFRQYTTAIDYVDTECIAGTLINAFYSYSTSLWNVIIITPSEIPSEIVDKSDITVYSATSDVITLFTPTIVDGAVIGATFISDGTIYGGVEPADPQYVFIKNETSNSYNGIYLDTFIDNGDSTYTHYLTKYINVEDLKIVRVQNGLETGVWQSRSVNDNNLITFIRLENASNHNELAALQGGTVNERYHVPLKNYNDIIGTVQTITAPFNLYTLTDANHNLIILNIGAGAPSGGLYNINNSKTTYGTTTIIVKNNTASNVGLNLPTPAGKTRPLSINEQIDTSTDGPITIPSASSYIVRITIVVDYIIIQ